MYEVLFNTLSSRPAMIHIKPKIKCNPICTDILSLSPLHKKSILWLVDVKFIQTSRPKCWSVYSNLFLIGFFFIVFNLKTKLVFISFEKKIMIHIKNGICNLNAIELFMLSKNIMDMSWYFNLSISTPIYCFISIS